MIHRDGMFGGLKAIGRGIVLLFEDVPGEHQGQRTRFMELPVEMKNGTEHTPCEN